MKRLGLESPEVADEFVRTASIEGAAILDELSDQLISYDPLAGGLFAGDSTSATMTTFGVGVHSVDRYIPGKDKPHRYNFRASEASGQPMATKVQDDVGTKQLRIVADMPERLAYADGVTSLQSIGRYAVALSCGLADKARANASLLIGGRGEPELLFEGHGSETALAVDLMDEWLETASTSQDQGVAIEEASPLASLLMAAEEQIWPKTDKVILISDFMSGYNQEHESFDWEGEIDLLNGELKDRLFVVRLKSPAQHNLPLSMHKGLSRRAVVAADRSYRKVAQQKERAIQRALEYTRSADIEAAGSSHPIADINDFLIHGLPEA